MSNIKEVIKSVIIEFFKDEHVEDIFNFIIKKYSEPWRAFHTFKHLEYLFHQQNMWYLNPEKDKLIKLVIIYHDLVYFPWDTNNEKHSAYKFSEHWRSYSKSKNEEDRLFVYNLILQTKDHSGTDEYSKLFNKWDMGILKANILKLLQYEKEIWYEYSFVPTETYKKVRLDFLKKNVQPKHPNLPSLISQVEKFRPKVGFYAGSFNPFHLGHQSIVEQAKKIFDKVVIVIAQNPSKQLITEQDLNERKEFIFSVMGGIEVVILPTDKFLTDLLKERSKEEEVFLIRGIRNSQDLEAEFTQYQYMKNLWQDLKLPIYINCPIELQHISSTGIRQMESIKERSGDVYLPKSIINN